MKIRELAVEGALEFTPEVFPDHRGLVVSPYQEPLFPVVWTIHSESRRGAVRGVHYTVTPPGAAKYVYCARGAALDIVVDIRVGSPTFGVWDTVRLDGHRFTSLYFPVGVGHAFVALADGTVMNYLQSTSYVPGNELALSPLDPELALPIPADIEPIMSERDRAAPGLAAARERGLLADYAECRRIDAALRHVAAQQAQPSQHAADRP